MKSLPKNLTQLDAYIKANPETHADGSKSLMSRYGALKRIYGERNADKIMRELEVSSWNLSGLKAVR